MVRAHILISYSSILLPLILWRLSAAMPTAPAAGRGISIPLYKRQIQPDAANTSTSSGVAGPTAPADASVIDFESIQRHVTMVDAKYQQGLYNYRKNTGQIFVVPEPTMPSTWETLTSLNFTSNPDSSYAKPSTASSPASTPTSEAMMRPSSKSYTHGQRPSNNQRSFAARGQSRLRARRTGSAPLKDISNDLLWVGSAVIGSNGQTFEIDFDTYAHRICLWCAKPTPFFNRGSADFWVPSVQCKAKGCQSHNKYDAAASRSSQNLDGKTFSM